MSNFRSGGGADKPYHSFIYTLPGLLSSLYPLLLIVSPYIMTIEWEGEHSRTLPLLPTGLL